MPETNIATQGEVNLLMPVRRIGTALAILQSRQAELQMVLPPDAQITVNIVIDSAISVLQEPRAQALLNCTGESIFRAVKEAATFGLSFHRTLGLAYLIAYKAECQLLVGYKGLLDLVHRATGFDVLADAVYEGDEYQPVLGAHPDVVHIPNLTVPRTPDKLTAAYFVAVKNGEVRHVENMTRAEIDEIRKRSKAANFGPWVTDYAMMARKTVIRRGAGQLPKSLTGATVLLAKAQEVDDRAVGLAASARELATPHDRTQALLERLAGKKFPITDAQIAQARADHLTQQVGRAYLPDIFGADSPEKTNCRASMPDLPDCPQAAPPITATNADKTALMRAINDWITARGEDALPTNDLILAVMADELPGVTKLTTTAEIAQVLTAIKSGRFDLATGDLIPPLAKGVQSPEIIDPDNF